MKPGVLLLLLLITPSVFSQKLKPAEYARWVSSAEYPLQVQQVRGQVVYTLKALTPEAVVSRQLLSGLIEVEEARALLKKNKGILSYELRIELPGGTDIYSYRGNGTVSEDERAVYWAFGCVKDFAIVSSAGESLECSYALTERGISGYPVSVISLDFPVYLSNASRITFLDRALSGELIEFTLTGLAVHKQPQLNLSL